MTWPGWPRRSAASLSKSIFAIAAAGGIAFAPVAEASLQELEASIRSVYENRSDAVVRVKVATEKTDEAGNTKSVLVVFSGFIISPDGKVITNAVPPKDTSRIWIEKNGLSYLAESIGSDERTNVSLLQVVNLPSSFTHIPIDTHVAPPAIGSFAISITSPLDFGPSPSFGLITGFESHFANITFPLTYIRAGLPIGPAEGGSPVFNANGALLGISMASMPEVRSSYLVPTRAIKRLVDDMLEHGKAKYGILPLEFEEKADRYNSDRQLLIKSITAGSPASRAGMKVGDQIESIDGEPVNRLNRLRDIIFYKAPGSFLLFKVRRDDRSLEFAILLEPTEDHQ